MRPLGTLLVLVGALLLACYASERHLPKGGFHEPGLLLYGNMLSFYTPMGDENETTVVRPSFLPVAFFLSFFCV